MKSLLMMVMLSTTAAPGAPPPATPPTPGPKAKAYLEFLRQEGYKAEIDADGDVKFRREGKAYYLRPNEDDPEFFHLLFVANLDDDGARRRAHEFAELVSRKTKVAKGVVVNDGKQLNINCELVLARPEDFKVVLERCCRQVDGAYRTVVKAAQE